MNRWNKADFLLIEKWAEDCIKTNARIESKSAFVFISSICNLAANRGQRVAGSAKATSLSAAIGDAPAPTNP